MISAAEPGNTGEPRFTANQLPDRYADALLDHLAHPGEPGLLTAQVLGRLALGDGVGLLEWAAVHHEALEALLLRMLMDETPAGGDGDSRLGGGDSRLGGGDSRLGGGDSRLGRIRHLRGLLRSLTPQERTAAMQAAQSFFTRSL